jgi:hypothetical protein
VDGTQPDGFTWFFLGFWNTDDTDGMDLHGFFWDFGTRMTRMGWIYTVFFGILEHG